MFSLNQKNFIANATLSQKVQTLIIGRLAVVFVLLVTSWIWYSGSTEFSLQAIPQGALLIFIISVGLTAAYLFILRISDQVLWQVRIQFLLDSLLITWLVWRTGDLTSPYITLYIVLIGVSSLFLRPTATILMAVLCLALFSSLAILTRLAMVESYGVVQSPAKIAQIVSFHAVAFLVVGLLASRLAERSTSGEKLKEATRTLQNLRQLQERIIESIRSGLVTTDLDGTIYTFNKAAGEITGFAPEDVAGHSIFDVFTGIKPEFELALKESGDIRQRHETELLTPEGFAVRIGFSVTELVSESNEASGYIMTFQDLTEIRSMEQSIRRKDRLAAVGRVGAGLAHEIRNPLGAMRGAIQVLESSMPPNSVQTDLMGIILRESDRLNSIITNFLSYAKPKVGKHSEIDLRDSIADTAKLLRHSPDVTPEHQIVEDLPSRPVFISADQTQIQQVFWNLTRNAIQAMPGGGTLKITLIHDVAKVRIIFEDSGHGMEPEQVEQLFEPFARSTSGGTGLGLSIVYQIIRDHNGTINVRSAVGEGTTITIELPTEHRAETPALDEPKVPAPIEAYLTVKK